TSGPPSVVSLAEGYGQVRLQRKSDSPSRNDRVPPGRLDTVARLGSHPGPIRVRDCYERWSSVAERTLVLIKPDAVRRGLVGEVISRFERKGLAIEAIERRLMDADLADRH